MTMNLDSGSDSGRVGIGCDYAHVIGHRLVGDRKRVSWVGDSGGALSSDRGM